MAKRAARGGRAAKSRTREPKAKSKKKPKASSSEVEVVEEAAGEGIDSGILIMTTLALFIAFLCIDAFRGTYGEGLFFGG